MNLRRFAGNSVRILHKMASVLPMPRLVVRGSAITYTMDTYTDEYTDEELMYRLTRGWTDNSHHVIGCVISGKYYSREKKKYYSRDVPRCTHCHSKCECALENATLVEADTPFSREILAIAKASSDSDWTSWIVFDCSPYESSHVMSSIVEQDTYVVISHDIWALSNGALVGLVTDVDMDLSIQQI